MASSTSTVAWLSVMVKRSQTVVKDTILKMTVLDPFSSLDVMICMEAETIHDVIVPSNDKIK